MLIVEQESYDLLVALITQALFCPAFGLPAVYIRQFISLGSMNRFSCEMMLQS
jgi:hypothetical protein